MAKLSNSIFTRNASDPYTLQLDDYILTEVELKKHALQRLGRWHVPSLKLLSFKDHTAEFSNTHEETSYKLFIKVEKESLHVSCSCASQVETLCIHAYKALEKLLSYGEATDYFTNFKPNGFAETAFANRKYFDMEDNVRRPMFKPKEWLGSIYNINEKLKGYNIDDVLTLPALPPQDRNENKDITICYMLMIAQRDDLLPFLIPCLGKLNKYRDEIKSFNNFLTGTDKAYEPFLTEEQKALNAICFEMWQQVDKLPGELIHEDMLFNKPDKLMQVFELWQKAMSLLQNQFVYKHPYFQEKQLKKNPSKSWSYQVKTRTEKPELQFLLTDKGAFYQLEIQFFINGIAVKQCEMIDEFFIEDMGSGYVYMFSSLRDAGISEWMIRSGNKITVFKEHFAEFEDNFLKSLQKYYTVKVVRKSLKLNDKKS